MNNKVYNNFINKGSARGFSNISVVLALFSADCVPDGMAEVSAR